LAQGRPWIRDAKIPAAHEESPFPGPPATAARAPLTPAAAPLDGVTTPEPATSRPVGWNAALGLAAAVVVGLDLARPYVGPGLRPWQWSAALLLIALTAGRWRRSGRPWGPAQPALALALLLVPTFVDHSRGLSAGDGMHYYSYLRSVLFDGDLRLENDYVLLGWHDPKAPNVLPIGAPLVWSPLVTVVHVLRSTGRLFGWGPPSGVEPVYQAAVCLATLLCGAAALFVLLAVLQRFVSPWVAFWTVVIAWVGSPLRFYLSVLPSLAHGVEFFGATLALRALFRLREQLDAPRAAWAGAACGLTFLARSQDGLLLALPAAEIAYQAITTRDWPRVWRAAGGLLAGFLVAALPQMIVWQLMFGAPVLIPHQKLHGADFLHTADPQLAGTLFSPRGGLFASHPAMLLAVAGLALLFRRERRYVTTLMPVLLAAWYVNATVFDWYQVRRFTGLVPFLAPGLAMMLVPISRAGAVVMALLAFLVLRYDLAVDARRSQPGDPAPVRALVADVGDGLARDVYRGLEPIAPRAAVLVLDSYADTALLRDTSSRLDLSRDLAVLRLPRAARHLSDVEVEDGVAGRWVRDREARLFLPLAWRGGTLVTVRARPLETEAPQTIELVWNDTALGAQEMMRSWSDYRFQVPAPIVKVGTNVVVVRFARAPVFHRVRGYGPREIRAAALAWIELHRHEE
jgi:hypothetical protein